MKLTIEKANVETKPDYYININSYEIYHLNSSGNKVTYRGMVTGYIYDHSIFLDKPLAFSPIYKKDKLVLEF